MTRDAAEVLEYMEACLLLARNAAEIFPDNQSHQFALAMVGRAVDVIRDSLSQARAASIRVDSCTASNGEPLVGFDFIGADGQPFAHGHVGMQEAQSIAEHIGKLIALRSTCGRLHS